MKFASLLIDMNFIGQAEPLRAMSFYFFLHNCYRKDIRSTRLCSIEFWRGKQTIACVQGVRFPV